MKISDPIILGSISGSIASAMKETIARYLFVDKGLAPFDGIQKGAGMMIQPYEIRTKKGTLVGILTDLTIGSTIGVVMATLHNKNIVKINPLNGSVIGLGAWTALYGTVGQFTALGKTTPTGAISSALWHLLYGAVTGGLISKLGTVEPKYATLGGKEKKDTQDASNGLEYPSEKQYYFNDKSESKNKPLLH